jgi:hypothetical protein
MRRTRFVTLLGGVLMAAFLLPSAAMASSAPAAAGSAAPAAVTTPAIDLTCNLNLAVMTPARPHVVCTWNAYAGAEVHAYRVWRSVDGLPRQLVGRVAPDKPLRFVDWALRAGHVYTYRVAAVAADGTRLALSDRAIVRYQRAPERLGFNCAYIIDATVSGARCHWAASTRPAAVRYVLFRSVDGGAREAIYRTPLNGRRTFLDTNVAAGQSIRYAVVALAADGRVVGIGGPDTVVIPTIAVPAP